MKSPADRRDPQDRANLRYLKSRVARGRAVRAVPFVDPEGLPIVTKNGGRYVHHGASPSDLRAILSRLPEGTASGIAAIELCPAPPDPSPRGELDPFVRRHASQILPRVYSPRVLGTYYQHTATIQLFAYVLEPEREDRLRVDLLLRLHALSTFVHELAHHDDNAFRGGKRHGRTPTVEARERYANQRERQWTREVVVPFLEEEYPTACRALASWLEEHAGIVFPLAALVSDPTSEGLAEAMFGPAALVEHLFYATARGESSTSTRLSCAHRLHLSGRSDDALRVLDKMLAVDADALEPLVLRGRVLLDEHELEDARRIADAVILRADANGAAFVLARHVACAAGDWQGMRSAAERIRAAGFGDLDAHAMAWNLSCSSEAELELGDLDGAARHLEAFKSAITTPTRSEQERAAALEARLLLARQKTSCRSTSA